MRTLLAAVLAALTAALVPAALAGGTPPAKPGKQKQLRAASGQVVAVVAFREQGLLGAKAVRLTIERADAVVLAQPLRSDEGGPATDRPSAVRVLDLDLDGEPEVLVDLYTGGAHCCTYSLIWRYDPVAVEYLSFSHQWGNVGYGPADLDGDGATELESADDRFAYAFTAYAFSGFPPQVWRYRAGALADVTREFPQLVRRSARELWTVYVRERHRRADVRDVRGVLAAWQACKALLGEADEGWAALRQARARGELRGAAGWPSGFAYLRALRQFLVQTGYLEP